MKDFLHRCLSVGEEQIDPLASHATRPHSGRQAMRHPHQMGDEIFVDVGEVRPMLDRDDEHVTWIHGLDVHERDAAIVAMREARREFVVQDPTEDAHDRGSAVGIGGGGGKTNAAVLIRRYRRSPILDRRLSSAARALEHEREEPNYGFNG
jgi:hypothetical protein